MRILVSCAAVAAFALGSTTAGVAARCTMMTGMSSHAMPKCSPVTGPVVWWMASAKTYFLKGSSHYGKGTGTYVCRATAVAHGGHAGTGAMSGSHGSMSGAHGSMGGSHATPGSAMPMTMTMAPRPMPGTTPGPGLPNSTNAAPGSMGSPMPAASGNPASGNQGNTGAPGAGGQVPNNPASTSNSNPSPTPHP